MSLRPLVRALTVPVLGLTLPTNTCTACGRGVVARLISCGCCTNGCVCPNHMDIPRGVPPRQCAVHAPNDAAPILCDKCKGPV